LRLFPLYWVAHIVYLVSPFQFRPEPIDYRFALSFLGDRVYPADTIFAYANSAWWFVGLLIGLYLMFPILYWMLREAGAAWFLLICGAVTIASRYLFLFVLPVTPNYLVGAFFGCRLWEFAFGMVMGLWYRQHREWMERHLFSSIALAAGVLIYAAGLYSNDWKIAYTLTDGLIGTGLFLIFVPLIHWGRRLRRVSAAMVYVGVYSYGLYLLHEPYLIYLGQLASHHGLSLAEFIAFAVVVITLLVLICSRLEQYVNRVTDRILRRYEHPTQVSLHPG
jgi:peptidoglycan/LPS O-acetylase OafA/YrhL